MELFPNYDSLLYAIIAHLILQILPLLAFAIAIIILLLPIEILVNKIGLNKYTLNIKIKNEGIILTYNILFWLGLTCSVLYVLLYIWILSKI